VIARSEGKIAGLKIDEKGESEVKPSRETSVTGTSGAEVDAMMLRLQRRRVERSVSARKRQSAVTFHNRVRAAHEERRRIGKYRDIQVRRS